MLTSIAFAVLVMAVLIYNSTRAMRSHLESISRRLAPAAAEAAGAAPNPGTVYRTRYSGYVAAPSPEQSAPATEAAATEPSPVACTHDAIRPPGEGARATEPEASTEADAPSEPEARRPRFGAVDWERFAGGRLFNIIGALTLVIGVGLFFKYAFEQNWIDTVARVALGVALGGGVTATGHVIRGRSIATWFADGIAGAGLAVLYLSGYASFQSYHLVPFAVAYGYMSIVTLVAFALGLRYDSISLSLIGWAGGFLTPFVLGDSVENELGLASYLVVLDIGMAAIGIVKSRWFVMQPLAMTATYVAAFYWYSQNATGSDWFVSVIAVSSLWFVFFASGVASSVRGGANGAGGALLAAANGLVMLGYLERVAGPHRNAFDVAIAAAAFAYAVAYGIVAVRLPKRRDLRVRYALCAVAALLVATFSHFHGNDATCALVIEAFCILTIAHATRVRAAIGESYELVDVGFGLVGFAWFVATVSMTANARPWVLDFGGADATAIVLIVLTLAIERTYARDRLLEGALSPILRLPCVALSCLLVHVHASGSYGEASAFALFALVLGWIGTRDQLADLEIESLALVVAAQSLFWYDFRALGFARSFGLAPLLGERFATLALVCGVTIVLGELARRRSLADPVIGRGLRLLGAIGCTVGSTFEVHDGFRTAVARLATGPQTVTALATIDRLVNGEPLAIMALWIATSLLVIGIGIVLRIREFRIYAIGVFDLTILKAFYDLHYLPNPYKIFAFVGLGIVLLGVSAVYGRLEANFFERPDGDAVPGGVQSPADSNLAA